MILTVPRETHYHEHRVGLAPFAVGRLVRAGHTVLVERDAGTAAHFRDRDYQEVGGQIVYDPDEIYQRADIVCRVSHLSSEELEMVRPGSVVCGFHHLAATPRERVVELEERGLTLLGYEILQDKGRLPVLGPISEMAGQMAVQTAATLLHREGGGRGILLGSVAGVPPPTVLILGAGAVGRSAARLALAMGTHTIILDSKMDKLRDAHGDLDRRPVTLLLGSDRLERYVGIADVIIGAILVPGERAPFLVTEQMVQSMKQGSVIVDVSIDQGGCVETSRPTTLKHPTFIAHGVLHYCVPNMTSNIARSATRAITSAALPYLIRLAERDPEVALREDAALRGAVYVHRGRLMHAGTGEAHKLPVTSWEEAIGKGART
jgi:alanine dehydrogenase